MNITFTVRCLLLVVVVVECTSSTKHKARCGPNCFRCGLGVRAHHCHRCSEGYYRVKATTGKVSCNPKIQGEVKTQLPSTAHTTAAVLAPATDAGGDVTVQPATNNDVSAVPTAAAATSTRPAATVDGSLTTVGSSLTTQGGDVTVQPATHNDVSAEPTAAAATSTRPAATVDDSLTTVGSSLTTQDNGAPAAGTTTVLADSTSADTTTVGVCTTPSQVGILVQQNINGSAFFVRLWADYKAGFGDVTGIYWIGNDRLHELTKNGTYKLRVDVQAMEDSKCYYAEYSTFIVDDESTGYTLHIGGYSGTAGDCWTDVDASFDGMEFSTSDRGPETACARRAGSGAETGFWYRNEICGYGFINSPKDSGDYGFSWDYLPTNNKTLLVSRVALWNK